MLDNLSRSEEGKKAIKDAGGMDCLSEVLDSMGYDDYIRNMCSKIYGKIAVEEDMKAQIDSLKSSHDKIKVGVIDGVNLKDVNKCLELISNFMLGDELGKQLQNPENYQLLEGIFEEMQKANLEGKDNSVLRLNVLINKYLLQIFYRLFSLKTGAYDKKTQAGKEAENLINSIQNIIKKAWEISQKLDENDKLETFSGYFSSYGDIIIQKYKVLKENQGLDEELCNTLCFINNNILKD